jgi:hypothetical protein
MCFNVVIESPRAAVYSFNEVRRLNIDSFRAMNEACFLRLWKFRQLQLERARPFKLVVIGKIII